MNLERFKMLQRQGGAKKMARGVQQSMLMTSFLVTKSQCDIFNRSLKL